MTRKKPSSNTTKKREEQKNSNKPNSQNHKYKNLENQNNQDLKTDSKESNQTNQISKKQKNNRLYIFFSRLVLLLTTVSSIITGYDIMYSFLNGNQNNSLDFNNSTNSGILNSSNFSLPLNQTHFLNNSTLSNSNSSSISQVNHILNMVNLGSVGLSFTLQISFLLADIARLDIKFLKSEEIKSYFRKNFGQQSNFFQSMSKLFWNKKPKDSEKFIEKNYAKYIFYKLSEIYSEQTEQEQILSNFIEILKNEQKKLSETKTKWIPEINLFLLRLFENSAYNVKKRKLKNIENSIEYLERYENMSPIFTERTKEFLQSYENHLQMILKYSKEKTLFWSFITQNLVLLCQSFDALATTYGTFGIAFARDGAEFFKYYTILTLGNGISWMLYDTTMNMQKEHELIIKNTTTLLNLKTENDLKFALTNIANPSHSVNQIRKEQSFFGSMNWYALPISCYFVSLGYSHFFDDRHYENTTVFRSLSILAMSTLLKRIEVLLKNFETQDNKSQLGKLSSVLAINILMPQGVALSFVQIMKDHNLNKYLILGGDLFANVFLGFMNMYLNVISQKYTAIEAENNLNNCLKYFEIEESESLNSKSVEMI